MTNVIQLRSARRPRRPHRPRPTARPALVPVSVEWDDTHHCDPELVALLAAVLTGTAA